jgi:YbgC/YbaW family acyl-CoA thioester hydrolase
MKQYCHLSYRVPFSETDAMGIVHHANHPKYMERGRVEFLRLAGLGYTEIVKQGFHFPLTDLQISYKKPLVFDEVILIETTISKVTRMRVNFEYRIFTGQELVAPYLTTEPRSGAPAVLGETLHCCVNEKGRPVEMTELMASKFTSLGNL